MRLRPARTAARQEAAIVAFDSCSLCQSDVSQHLGSCRRLQAASRCLMPRTSQWYSDEKARLVELRTAASCVSDYRCSLCPESPELRNPRLVLGALLLGPASQARLGCPAFGTSL